jgi:hypothetical protein
VHLLRKKVIRAAGDLVRFFRVRYRLDRRGVEGKDHHLHSVLVHQTQPALVNV